MSRIALFDAADYLDSEEVIAEYLNAALEDGNPDVFLRAVADEMAAEGIIIAPSTLFLSHLLAAPGPLSHRSPTPAELDDINLGVQAARELGRLDIGQCAVVRRQVIVALETIEGTDATIRRGGNLSGPGAVVVKMSKPGQDLRFDVPAVGLDTIAVMQEAKAAVLAIEAGKTLIFDRADMLQAADQAGIAVWGIS